MEEKNKSHLLREITFDMKSRIIHKISVCECMYSVPDDLGREIIDLVDEMRDMLLYEFVQEEKRNEGRN